MIKPSKRKAPSTTTDASTTTTAPRSKLAKEHNITGIEENEIKEAFSLFSEPLKGEKHGVLPTKDIKQAMVYVPYFHNPRVYVNPLGISGKGNVRSSTCPNTIVICRALNIPPTPSELKEFVSILDPDSEGYTDYPSFLAICALKFHNRSQNSSTHIAEVDEAFSLFTTYPLTLPHSHSAANPHHRQQESALEDLLKGEDGEERITLSALKRVARALKEDVDEDLLRDMILEANGGKGVGRGVTRGEFEAVMRKAGVWR